MTASPRERTDMTSPARHPASADAAPVILRAEGVSKTFGIGPAATTVLPHIDLDVAEGEFLTVMGPSGSGKSTLLHCLSDLDRPTSGAVTLDSIALATLSDDARAQVRLTKMGFVFQQPHFLSSLSIRDNILLPALKAARAREEAIAAQVDRLLARFEISDIAHHAVSEASGGQLQRAGLCRALATWPRVIFADEPTGALGQRMSLDVMDALSDTHRDGTTIVAVTHSPTLAARASRVLYLRDGVVTDTLSLGAWTASDAVSREATLHDWLRQKGY